MKIMRVGTFTNALHINVIDKLMPHNSFMSVIIVVRDFFFRDYLTSNKASI